MILIVLFQVNLLFILNILSSFTLVKAERQGENLVIVEILLVTKTIKRLSTL